ncbi:MULTISPECIES: hypothetical protein [Sporosarcina]|nr:hypothetical protein [Sporosarcina psychrophila]AMQ05683.1 hypothetical protein AZE41_07010 [Sporosarcina psychrophila]
MKRTLGLTFILLSLFLAACGGPLTYTASTLVVVKKGHSDKDHWIEAYDPNNQNKEEAFKIMVQEEMVWNLIEEDREYFSMYSKKKEVPWRLTQIEHSVAEER